MYQEKASAEIRGEFFRTNSRVNFAGFFGGFFGAFFLGKTGGKNPQQNSNQNLGASRPKFTLQESGLEKVWARPPTDTFHRLTSLCSPPPRHVSICVVFPLALVAPSLLRSGGVLVEVVFFNNCRVTTLLCISA